MHVIQKCRVVVAAPRIVAVPAIVMIGKPLSAHLSVELSTLSGVHASPVFAIEGAIIVPSLFLPVLLVFLVSPAFSVAVVIAIVPAMIVVIVAVVRICQSRNGADHRDQHGGRQRLNAV